MRPERLEIVWTRRAASMLTKAHDYIEADNPSAAHRLVDDIHSRLNQIAAQPGLGFKSKVRASLGEIREFIVAPYRILYRADSTTNRLMVLLVWHGSRRNPARKDIEATG